jgi:hypothetical protein
MNGSRNSLHGASDHIGLTTRGVNICVLKIGVTVQAKQNVHSAVAYPIKTGHLIVRQWSGGAFDDCEARHLSSP